MSDSGPLFLSAIELLAHAIELYGDDSRKRKFVVLHLANAIEVLLKDLMVDQGISIYEPKRGITVNIWAAFDSLEVKGIAFPERPVIEILVDDRNAIQHRFGSPDAKTVSYYLEKALGFFARILKDHYDDLVLAEVLSLHLSPEVLQSVGLGPTADEPIATRVFEQSPEWAFLYAFGYVESLLHRALPKNSGPLVIRHPDLPRLIDDLANEGYIPCEAGRRFSQLVELRNRVAHSGRSGSQGTKPSRDEFDLLQSLADGLKRALADGFPERRGVPSEALPPPAPGS
jgi:uncharacterized protein YutE (UPF0331/DUF86 family)